MAEMQVDKNIKNLCDAYVAGCDGNLDAISNEFLDELLLKYGNGNRDDLLTFLKEFSNNPKLDGSDIIDIVDYFAMSCGRGELEGDNYVNYAIIHSFPNEYEQIQGIEQRHILLKEKHVRDISSGKEKTIEFNIDFF